MQCFETSDLAWLKYFIRSFPHPQLCFENQLKKKESKNPKEGEVKTVNWVKTKSRERRERDGGFGKVGNDEDDGSLA